MMEQVDFQSGEIVGRRVEVVALEGIYRGDTVAFNHQNGQLTLKNVKILLEDNSEDFRTSSSAVVGQLNFFREDVRRVTFLDDDRIMGDPNFEFMHSISKPSHLKNQSVSADDQLVEIPKISLPYLLPHVIINNIYSNDFRDAISSLRSSKIIGMAAEGIRISRNGKLSWLALCNDKEAFLFDISKLGENAFYNGLADVLENPSVSKVIHDSRFISDCLYHQFRVMLQNVWDTQVASALVFRRNHFGDLPRFVDPLLKCLEEYLSVSTKQFPPLYYRSYSSEEDQKIWDERPLHRELEKRLVGEVMFLRQLRRALTEKLLTDFVTGVDIYLDSVRLAPDGHVDRLLNATDLLPTEFIRGAEREIERKEADLDRILDPSTGFQETVSSLKQSNIRFSKDMWHISRAVEQSENSLEQ